MLFRRDAQFIAYLLQANYFSNAAGSRMLTNLEPDVRNRVYCILHIITRMIRVKRKMMMKRRTRTTKRKRRRMLRRKKRMSWRKRKETPYFSELYSTDFSTALNVLRAMFLRVLFRTILRHYKVPYSTKFLW